MQSAQSIIVSPAASYHDDFYAWTQCMVEALRQRDWDAIDIENLAEEIAALGKGDRRAIKSRLEILIMHLLKWQFQPDQRRHSWKATLTEQRLRIDDLLADSPSLTPYVQEILPVTYKNARKLAADEIGLGLDRFPETCPYAIAQLLDEASLEAVLTTEADPSAADQA